MKPPQLSRMSCFSSPFYTHKFSICCTDSADVFFNSLSEYLLTVRVNLDLLEDGSQCRLQRVGFGVVLDIFCSSTGSVHSVEVMSKAVV